MLNKTFVITSICAAVFMAISLKFLHLFKFIKWAPTGWAKNWSAVEALHYSIKWFLLIIGLTIIFSIIYLVTSFMEAIPPTISSIVLCIAFILLAEWMITKPETPLTAIKSMSIPFFSITAIILRFIIGTSIFMRELSRKV